MTAHVAFDAKAISRDPTGTAKLRASFRAAAKLRLRQLRAQLRTALIDHDVLGLSQGTMGFHPADVRLNAFHAWLGYMAGQFLAGNWPDRFIEQAWESGRQVAAAEVVLGGYVPSSIPGTSQHLTQLAKQELDGIIAATVQQVSREAAAVLQRRLKPAAAWRFLAAAFDKVAFNRLMAMANVLVVTAFNQAKLEIYRAAGIEKVGIIPETTPRNAPKGTFRDQEPPDEMEGGSKENERTAQTIEALIAWWIARALGHGREEKAAEREEQIGVLTAGDELVCQKCDNIAAGSPYTLNTLPMIPVHPNCRCSIYAWRG